MAPAAGSIVLHFAIAAAMCSTAFWADSSSQFLGKCGAGRGIQVNIVSNAIPLPSTQPVNQNVLATETPSQAPAPPEPKAKQAQDETAIPIQGKQKKPEQKTAPRTPPRQPTPVQNNRADYGEQSGSSMPHATQPSFSSGPTSVNNGDFGSRFGWYVEQINRTMGANWYKAMVEQTTPRGAKAYIDFKIAGRSVGDVRLDRSSEALRWTTHVCARRSA